MFPRTTGKASNKNVPESLLLPNKKIYILTYIILNSGSHAVVKAARNQCALFIFPVRRSIYFSDRFCSVGSWRQQLVVNTSTSESVILWNISKQDAAKGYQYRSCQMKWGLIAYANKRAQDRPAHPLSDRGVRLSTDDSCPHDSYSSRWTATAMIGLRLSTGRSGPSLFACALKMILM